MILIVTQVFAPARGGIEYTMTELANQLANAGHQVTVLADGAKEGFTLQSPYVLKLFCGPRPWRRWQKRCAIAKIAAHQKITGIICDSWKSVEALPRKFVTPIAVLAHGAEYPLAASPHKIQRITAALQRATSIIANSHYTADLVRPYLPFPDDARLTIIHPAMTAPPQPSEAAHKEIAHIIGGRGPVISVVARLEERKGVDRVIAALPELIKNYPDIILLIGGAGADKDRLAGLTQKLSVAQHVVFLGRIDDDVKSAVLDASAIFAMPVRRVGASVEGFGLSYIEAAWFSVPALGGMGCGASDAVIDGETGLLCDGADQAKVTQALARMLSDEKLRRQWGRAAQIRAQSDLTWDKTLPRYLRALGIATRATS